MRRLLLAGFSALGLASAVAFADEFVFLSHDSVSLAKLLPPPPFKVTESCARATQLMVDKRAGRSG